MDIKARLRQALTEKEEKPAYDFGCVMIFLDVEKKDWDEILDSVDDEDLYLGEDGTKGTYGKEHDPHATILYGIHKEVPDEDVEELIEKIKRPHIELKKVSIFDNPEFDVLKYDIESEDLKKYNKMFSDKLPNTNRFPDYHPHATIAFLKKGKGAKYVKLLNKREALDIEPQKIVYSKPVSGKNAKKEFKLK